VLGSSDEQPPPGSPPSTVSTASSEVEQEVKVVEQVKVTVPPSRAAWPATLTELAKQVDTVRLYDRDLRSLAQSLDEVLRELARRPGWRRLTRDACIATGQAESPEAMPLSAAVHGSQQDPLIDATKLSSSSASSRPQ
jgi:hypothetical protein